MIWHEIVKYSSENYGENGVYTKDEWTSRSDIGTVYEGKTFTLEKYLDVEQRYINVVLSHGRCHQLQVYDNTIFGSRQNIYSQANQDLEIS